MTEFESVPDDIIALMGEMTERQQQTLGRLLAEVGEARARELIAMAEHRLAHPKHPERENSPKTVRAALWEIIHEQLTPPMFTRVFDVKAPPPEPKHLQWPWRKIARRLGEYDQAPQQQVRELLVVAGPRMVEATVAEAEAIYANGGMVLPGRGRRRTLGGIFFHLIRQKMTPAQIGYITGWQKKPAPPSQQAQRPLSPEDLLPALEWAARKDIYRELLAEQGEGRTMKVTLVGRPGRVVEKKDVVITSIKLEKKMMVPRGVPQPLPTTYSVYIGRKQWAKVKHVLDDPEDLLVIEGYACYDPDMEGIVVSVTAATTRSIQLAKRAPKQQPADAAPGESPPADAAPGESLPADAAPGDSPPADA